MIIVPSILTDSLEVVQRQVDLVLNEKTLTKVQVDIIDPDFAEEVTIHPIDLLEVELKGLSIDVHLMTNDPINDVVECSQIPGIDTIIAQIERMPSQRDFYEHCHSFSLKTGFSVDLYTPIDELKKDLLSEIDVIQVMGNKAGKQGQPFIGEAALEKIRALSKMRTTQKANFLISVDIGMTPENAKRCIDAGADMITPGSYLWNAKDFHTAIEAYSENM